MGGMKMVYLILKEDVIKTIDLSEENEPDIYQAIKKGALLENVWQ